MSCDLQMCPLAFILQSVLQSESITDGCMCEVFRMVLKGGLLWDIESV